MATIEEIFGFRDSFFQDSTSKYYTATTSDEFLTKDEFNKSKAKLLEAISSLIKTDKADKVYVKKFRDFIFFINPPDGEILRTQLGKERMFNWVVNPRPKYTMDDYKNFIQILHNLPVDFVQDNREYVQLLSSAIVYNAVITKHTVLEPLPETVAPIKSDAEAAKVQAQFAEQCAIVYSEAMERNARDEKEQSLKDKIATGRYIVGAAFIVAGAVSFAVPVVGTAFGAGLIATGGVALAGAIAVHASLPSNNAAPIDGSMVQPTPSPQR